MEECLRLNDLVTSADPPDPFISPDHALEPRNCFARVSWRWSLGQAVPKKSPVARDVDRYHYIREALSYYVACTLMDE